MRGKMIGQEREKRRGEDKQLEEKRRSDKLVKEIRRYRREERRETRCSGETAKVEERRKSWRKIKCEKVKFGRSGVKQTQNKILIDGRKLSKLFDGLGNK